METSDLNMQELPKYDQVFPPPAYSSRVLVKKKKTFTWGFGTACVCFFFSISLMVLFISIPNVIIFYNSSRIYPLISITNEKSETRSFNCSSSFVVPTCINYATSNSGYCNGSFKELVVISKASNYSFSLSGGKRGWTSYCSDCRLFSFPPSKIWYSSLNSTKCGDGISSDSDLLSIFYVCISFVFFLFVMCVICSCKLMTHNRSN